jgi:hypothetical protein
MAEGDTRILTSKAYRALSTVLDYLDDEQKDWEQWGKPDAHIWLSLRQLWVWLEGEDDSEIWREPQP